MATGHTAAATAATAEYRRAGAVAWVSCTSTWCRSAGVHLVHSYYVMHTSLRVYIYIYVATLLEQPRDTRISLLRTAAASICCWVVQEVG